MLAAGAGLSAAGLLALVGPHPIGPASGCTGDAALLARAEPHLRGLNRVALAYIDGDTTTYAGIGAGERMRFGIGSLSKTFCGAVLMDMVAKDEVRLDTTVGELIDANQSDVADVTLRELASHTSGLPDFTAHETSSSNAWFGLLHADGSRQDAADTVADILGQQLTDRGTYSYSTDGIALLAHVLGRRAGTTYKKLLTERILTPFDLTDTSLPVTRAGLPDGWEKGLLGGRPAEPWTLNGLAPGGGMWSSCADLATWMRLTRDGLQPGAAGLQPVAPAPLLPWLPDAKIAITWVLATTPAGDDLIFHNGLTGSHHSYVGYCPRTGRGLAYLVNSAPSGEQLLMLQGDLVGTLLDEGV
ncbi:CubicO group peptidase (beta-lactamase class C family) [Rhodoglobus vestalii]|uniref:CubicO group peptidase (Beta-lactamase class C family) n=1 Tax=Rhodoglobus vestalii TaxID=193384 RepID=A0A8H2PWT1_9MICO|nr:CubicO group peptidase (beta-lactamase class C family) [Rhodoglobus vestalii]